MHFRDGTFFGIFDSFSSVQYASGGAGKQILGDFLFLFRQKVTFYIAEIRISFIVFGARVAENV